MKRPASSFFSHKMKKCAGGSFYAAGHFSFWVSGWRRVFLGRQQEPPRAPAGGREETRSPPILPAPSPATDKKRIYRLFSALPGNNRSQKEVFLVQLGCAGGNFAITQPLLPKNRSCLFFQIWLCCLRMYKVAGFSILRQVFP